jgi:GT2 family glycosyltransferase
MTTYVGIVTYNSLPDLPACIESLHAQDSGPLPITILDNASTDETPAWIAGHAPDCHLIRSDTNCGYGRGHNRILSSLSLSPGDFYLALNPDVTLAPGYITNLSNTLQSQQADWGTGKLILPGGGSIYSTGHALLRSGYALNIGYALPDGPEWGQSHEVFGAPGAALLISHTLIQALAPDGDLFDPDFFLYGEDIDLDWRARHRGFHCWYEAGAVASHRGSAPAEDLRVHALGNRYLAVIKNAHLLPLLTINLPLMILHCLARLIVSPRYGWHLIGHLARLGPRMWRKRSRRMLPRRVMRRWFRWGRRQPSGQPGTIRARLRHYAATRRSLTDR